MCLASGRISVAEPEEPGRDVELASAHATPHGKFDVRGAAAFRTRTEFLPLFSAVVNWLSLTPALTSMRRSLRPSPT